MKVIIQRVSQASVSISDKVVGKIQGGLMLLLGFEANDTQEDLEWLSRKIINLRIFDDTEGVMNLSVKDTSGEILAISQFTLHASTKKGNRPSYIKAAKPELAIPLYESFLRQLENQLNKPIEQGIFGANMQVSLINDGPVTIIIDTKNKE